MHLLLATIESDKIHPRRLLIIISLLLSEIAAKNPQLKVVPFFTVLLFLFPPLYIISFFVMYKRLILMQLVFYPFPCFVCLLYTVYVFSPILFSQFKLIYCVVNSPPVLLPVFFDLEAPLPLEVLVLVVVGEQRGHGVRPAGHHAGRGLLERGRVALDFLLRRVRADHLRHFVHGYSHSVGLLHVLQPVDDLPLDDKVNSNLVLNALLDDEDVLFQLRNVPGQVQFHRVAVGHEQGELFHNHLARVGIVVDDLLRLGLPEQGFLVLP